MTCSNVTNLFNITVVAHSLPDSYPFFMGVCSIRFELNKNNAGGQDNQTTIIGCAFNI